MAMDLLTLAKTIAPLAPVAGSIIGGFLPIPGGSIIGQKLGSFIAQQFGLPANASAGQIGDAIATAGEETARAKINAALEQARAQIQGFTEIEKAHAELMAEALAQTNETMRVELAHEHPFYTGWRPFIGWVFGVVALCFGLMLVAATARATWLSSDPLRTLSEAWPIFLSFFGPLGAAVGVLIKGRSDEKSAAIQSNAPMPNAVVPPAPAKPAPADLVKAVKATIGKPPGARD